TRLSSSPRSTDWCIFGITKENRNGKYPSGSIFHGESLIYFINVMAKDFYGELQLGVLGGGQLGRMLIQEAINYNVNVHVLDPDKNAPCRKLCNRFECGALDDFDTVYQFGKDLDMITIEIEKVNVDALEK